MHFTVVMNRGRWRISGLSIWRVPLFGRIEVGRGVASTGLTFKEDNRHIVTVNRDPEQYTCKNIEDDRESLNKLLDWWTHTPYDHYHEWLSEIYDGLKRAGKI